MSQAAAIAAFDLEMHAAMGDAGLADAGAWVPPPPKPLPNDYTPPEAVPVRCFVDRALQRYGQAGQVVDRADEVAVLLADLAAPLKGGTLTVAGVTYTLDRETDNDGSISRWTVRRG